MAQLLRRHAGVAVAAAALAAFGSAGAWTCEWGSGWRSHAVLLAHPRISTSLTWHADIAPLFVRHCASCHAERVERVGGGTSANQSASTASASIPLSVSTISLATYADVRPWAGAIRESVLERQMPPVRGRPGMDAGVDDHPLSPMERDLVVAWIDGGAPEGRPGTSPTATFWCVMHPEIRADKAGACPLCAMPLSAFTPDLTRRYGWSFDAARLASLRARTRRGAGAGARRNIERDPQRVTFSIGERTTGARVRGFERVHEYPLHLFIVSEDFRSFEHVHPELKERLGATWAFAWRPPASGRYWFYGDFLPTGGGPQMLQRAIDVGPPTVLTRVASLDRDVLVATADGIEATLAPMLSSSTSATSATLRSGDEHRFAITVRDAATHAPINDLQSYLGAWGHLFVLHERRDEALHAHPDSTNTTAGGPTIAFDVLFPRAGTYYLWAQVQRRGLIITLPFVVRVAPRA